MTLCPIPDCGQPAGTRCTMAGCPGTSLRPRSSSPGERKGAVSNPLTAPTSFDPVNAHAPHNTQVIA